MAIPFFEPRSSETVPLGDQVDGQGSSPAPTAATTTTASSTDANSAFILSHPPAANEQVLAWKILALAMCKALKEYYLQSSGATEAFTSGNGSLVKILPNGQVHPVWK